MNDTNEPNDQITDLPLDQARPYRSPAEISERGTRTKSIVAWVAAGGLVVCGLLAYAYARNSANKNLTDHVKGFSGYRGEIDEDEWNRGGDYWDAYHRFNDPEGAADEG